MKKIMTQSLSVFPMILGFTLICGPFAFSAENIVHSFRSPRAMAMGGVLLTTGHYTENFFGNPARVTADPIWKIQMPDPTIELNTGSISMTSKVVSALGGEGDAMSSVLASVAGGETAHIRYQMAFPGLYWPNVGGGKMSYAFALLTSVQTDVQVANQFSINPQAIADVGPALMVGRKFLPEDALAVGISLNATYRLISRSDIPVQSVLRGKSLSPLGSAGQGTTLDFGIGSTYRLPITAGPWVFDVGASLVQILDGALNLGIEPAELSGATSPQPRAFGFGIAAKRPTWWAFSDFSVALEFQDIGNNTNGDFFRLIHIGSEIKWRLIALRAGLNQGYWTVGLGFDLKAIQLDFTTYGEEMSLVTGNYQNRVLALRLGFQI